MRAHCTGALDGRRSRTRAQIRRDALAFSAASAAERASEATVTSCDADEVPDHVERPDLPAALRRDRESDGRRRGSSCGSSVAAFGSRRVEALQLAATSLGRAPVEEDAAPDFEVEQRQQPVGAVDAVRRRARRSARCTVAGSEQAARGDRRAARAARAGPARARPSATRPSACRSRASCGRGCRAAAGRRRRAFITCFSSPPRILTASGMRAASSTSSWSSSGTRHSSEIAMLILSVSSSRSSGSCVSASTASMRLSASSLVACRNASAIASRRARAVQPQQPRVSPRGNTST